jgi:ferredoxin
MMWDNDAEKRFELLPVPPMMKSYARLQAEKIARGRGLARVTDACVRETEQVYRDFIGEEKTEQLRAYVTGEGPEPQLMDELFFDDEQALYHVDVCYTKYGENSELVRNELVAMMRRLQALMKEEGLTEIMAGLAPVALHGASRFTVGMTGCPNCCVSPYLRDFGIIMQHRVDITDAGCTGCGNCLKMCMDHAIRLTDEGPVIDRSICARCELCARDCPTGTLAVNARGYRVIAGGAGGRHPQLAVTVEDFIDRERVLVLLRNAIAQLRHARPGESLRDIINRDGIAVLR